MVRETIQNKTVKQNNFKQYQSDEIEQGNVKRMTGVLRAGAVTVKFRKVALKKMDFNYNLKNEDTSIIWRDRRIF